MSLTTQEKEQFENEGYVVKRGVFQDADLEPFRAAMNEIVESEAGRLQSEGKLNETFPIEGFERRLAAIAEVSPEAGTAIYEAIIGKSGGGFSGPAIFDMLVHLPLLSCVESLLGPEIVASSVYRLRPKLPGFARTDVPWHQDSGYYMPHCDHHTIVTCWVPIVDATLENGCLWVQPKSHKGGIFPHHIANTSGYLIINDEDLPEVEPIPIEMKAGDVLLLTNITPHCSKGNDSNSVRWSFDLRYQSMDSPSNVGEMPEDFNAERDPFEMACYPPEADFVVRSAKHPEREIRDAQTFRDLRERYTAAHHIAYPERGWKTLPETIDAA